MGKKLLIICFGLFMLLTIVKIIVDNKNLDENFKYTKARIIQIKPVKGGKAIIMNFVSIEKHIKVPKLVIVLMRI